MKIVFLLRSIKFFVQRNATLLKFLDAGKALGFATAVLPRVTLGYSECEFATVAAVGLAALPSLQKLYFKANDVHGHWNLRLCVSCPSVFHT